MVNVRKVRFLKNKKSLCKEWAWERSDKYTLDRKIVWEISKNNRLVTRVVWVRYQICKITLMTELLECCLIIDESSYNLSILWDTRLLDENQITVIDSFLIHRVSLSPQEKIFLGSRNESARNWNLSFDILISKYRHTTSNRPNEWNHPDLMTIWPKIWRDADLILTIPIDPSLGDELIDENWYRTRWSIPKSALECSYRHLLTPRDKISNLLKDKLFFIGEFFHAMKEKKYKYIRCIQTYIFINFLNANFSIKIPSNWWDFYV